jgi:hypothetical protein
MDYAVLCAAGKDCFRRIAVLAGCEGEGEVRGWWSREAKSIEPSNKSRAGACPRAANASLSLGRDAVILHLFVN